tara:strand:+ start:935 stop:1168 length:234 start_codon:yes stop_codon:yes gene_type:complete
MEVLKQSLSDTPKKTAKDPCPVCNYDLHLNEVRSKRIGIVDNSDRVVGWICYKCKTEFDMEDLVIVLFSEEEIRGEA